MAYAVVSRQLHALQTLSQPELRLLVGTPLCTHAVPTPDGEISVEVGVRWKDAKHNAIEIFGVAYGASHWHTERVEESMTVALN